MKLINPYLSEKKKEELALLTEKVKDLKAKISELRKKGHDPIIADYTLRQLSPKIQWAGWFNNEEEFEKVKKLLKVVQDEIEEEERRELVDVKKEVEERVSDEHFAEKKAGSQAINDVLERVNQVSIEFASGDRKRLESTSKDFNKANEIITSVDKKPNIIHDQKLDFSEETLPSKYFHLRSGMDLKSIGELVNNIPSMSEDDFRFHTRYENNDFAKWIEEVFNRHDIAKKIKGLNDKKEFIKVLIE